ncbi:GTPase IMAP family member 4-like [Poecilia latipinna]|uniref:GTPase IMAP family member 4-like n=1 Tax=Poecilia latipinna TaxID=48699 RepID=UPI00072EAEEA|nr:PREDICTED: GTPase IMAP family member 4-like [Poecilia latipinna]
MEARRVRDYQFYVWDHVALALHVENDQVLKLDFKKPEDFLTYCEKDDVTYRFEFQNLDEANELVKKWPEWLGALKVERPLQMHYPVTELKLVLTGSCGEETSSTGNTLSGKQAFYSSGLDSVEMKLDNLEVKIINTPEFSELTTKEEIKKTLNYIRLSGPALHVFLLVISLKNITADLIRTTVQRFESIFQNKALRRTMILFTHQDQTEPDIQEIMQKVQQFLTEKVGNRCLVFNNRLEDRDPQRVSDLLREVKKILGGE